MRQRNRKRPLVILAYRGYGTPKKLYIKGRVIEDKGITTASEGDSTRLNFANMMKRFFNAEVPHARIKVRFQGMEQEVTADAEGYFEIWIEPSQPLPADRIWHEIELDLIAPRTEQPVHTTATVLVPPASAQFGVISDIDDTVIHTDAVNLARMVGTVMLGNAHTRLLLKGVAAFYRALFQGNPEHAQLNTFNPLFYISNSPWNLYDLLSEFFHLHNIPIGPVLFLRQWGFTKRERLPTRIREHKLTSARNILTLFPELPFILIGDSGEQDPEIYAELVSQFPQRIQAVYIRNVSRKVRRPAELGILADKVLQAGSTLILADDTWPLAQHAAQQGWITPASLIEIEAERDKDTAPRLSISPLNLDDDTGKTPTIIIKPDDTK
jgi:phosphatidate phosphatase APP1